MITKEIVIENKQGLGMRAAVCLARLTGRFDASAKIRQGGNEFNAKSILGIMSARIRFGDTVRFECAGGDEYDLMKAIVDAAARGFE
ncbi:MAG: HPr family phosphocarrier protein [Clostridiales bacterium]|jgi:phosphocarrier protein|nr:HPr family phosphocarrier protein [Clostridiales bacterium]